MKYLAIFVISIPSFLFAQEPVKQVEADTIESQHQIPINPNKVDEQGRKTGKWTILFDKDWKEIDNITAFYRLITYKEDKPVGKMGDYYLNGQIQMEAKLISDDPETYDGEVIWYSPVGNITNLKFYNDGHFDYNETNLRLRAIVGDQRKTGEKHSDYVISLYNLAELYNNQGLYAKAEPLHIEAKNISEKVWGKEHPAHASALNNLAIFYINQGLYAKAEPLFIETKNIEEKVWGKEDSAYAFALSNLASLYKNQGLYAKAEPLYIEAKNIKEKVLGKESRSYTYSLNMLARLYNNQGLYAKAETLFIEAKNIYEKVLGKEHPSYAETLSNLASLYNNQGLYAKAETLYIEANIIYEKVWGKKNTSYAYSLINLASLYNNQGLYAKAEPLYIEAKNIEEKVWGKEHPDYASALNNLAQLYHQTNKNVESTSLFLWTKKYYLEYVENTFAAMGEREREQFYATLLDYFETFQNFAIEESSQSPEILVELYNLQLATKSILLNTSNLVKRRIMQSYDRVLIDLYDEVQSLKQVIGRNQNLTLDEIKIDIDSLNELLSEKDKLLSEYASFYAEEQKQYTWQDVKSTLGKHEAAIEIIRLNKWDFQRRKSTDTVLYAALIVTPKTKKYPELVLFTEGNELEGKYIKYYRTMTRIRKEDTLSYDHFWSPLKKHLKGIKTVYFSPDGVFNSLNLQTLYNPKTKKYLMEEVDIRLVTSTKDLLTTKSPTMRFNYVILMGNPDFGQEARVLANRNVSTTFTLDSLIRNGISSLPGTKIEIDLLSELFKQKGWDEDVWTEQDATEEHLKNMNKPKVLHIATHGFFEPDDDEHTYQNNPLYRSGLLLSGAEKVFQNDESVRGNTILGKEDGVLTAFEAMNLNIENTELVVLSACETGLGEIRNGEGVYGLQRAFQVAGARSLMISLWKVSDQVTQELMVDFYTNWLGGLSKREALKKTQLMLKEKYESPFYWGAFVLVGE